MNALQATVAVGAVGAAVGFVTGGVTMYADPDGSAARSVGKVAAGGAIAFAAIAALCLGGLAAAKHSGNFILGELAIQAAGLASLGALGSGAAWAANQAVAELDAPV